MLLLGSVERFWRGVRGGDPAPTSGVSPGQQDTHGLWKMGRGEAIQGTREELFLQFVT